MSASLRELIDGLSGDEFTIPSLKPELDRLNLNLNSVSSALNRFVKEGVVWVVEPGAGRRPTTYTRKDPSKSPSLVA